jgi:GT2 family glycosyltransferase
MWRFLNSVLLCDGAKVNQINSDPAACGAIDGTGRYTILILTYNRNHLLEPLLKQLKPFADHGVQIIVVDNASKPSATVVTGQFQYVLNIRSEENLGAAGRNLGFAAATGETIICLDDDVEGLSVSALECLDSVFSDEVIGAANFKVMEKGSGRVANWVHHRKSEQYANSTFDTYEITEGAVAIRRAVFQRVGGYPERFFLSHEGPDLAFRIMNLGLRVIYCPDVIVTHSFAHEGRTAWRNYYLDTRNTFWLAARNLPVVYGARLVVRQTLAMLAYSLRDGYFRWWVRGVADGLRGLRDVLKERQPLNREAFVRLRAIDRFRPGVVYMLRKRLFRRGVTF